MEGIFELLIINAQDIICESIFDFSKLKNFVLIIVDNGAMLSLRYGCNKLVLEY